MRPRIALASLTALACLLVATRSPAVDEPDFKSIFDGKTLTGWHVSGKTGHGTGGRWSVENGAIVGSQDRPGNGGIIITDKAYGDFEVSVEMNNDFGPDSGLFLRSTEDGRAYQAMIDYHGNGNLMGIYGEGLSGGISVRNFDFGSNPSGDQARRLPVQAACHPREMARVLASWTLEYLPRPHRGESAQDHHLDQRREIHGVDRSGASPPRPRRHRVQVHGGSDHTREFVRYRNVRVKELGKD